MDIRRAVRADRPVGTTQLVLFIPSKDRTGEEIGQAHWVHAGLEVLGRLFRGATAFPPGRGVWRDDDRGGALLYEATVMILCYANAKDVTSRSLTELRRFLLRLGRETRQGEVGVVIDAIYYGFTRFSEE